MAPLAVLVVSQQIVYGVAPPVTVISIAPLRAAEQLAGVIVALLITGGLLTEAMVIMLEFAVIEVMQVAFDVSTQLI